MAGYAATQTRFDDLVRSNVTTMSESGIPVLGLTMLAAALLCTAALVLVRRLRGKAERQVQQGPLANPLAAVAGREKFLATLAGQIDTHAAAGRQLALHLIDIDRFHLVNGVLGEAQGDQLLGSVAERLLVLVEDPDRLARIGDDEFAVLQLETGGARHAEIYARRIEDTLKDACAQVPRHARPGASIGVAVAPEHGQDTAALLHSASLALRAAKKAGGDTFRLHAREMDMGMAARLQMEKMLGEGLHQGWFELHYQPQYDLRSRRLTGFEALVRMNHPDDGELLPDEFLPTAELSGLIQPLGEWIVREALTVAVEWPPHLTLSINVAAAQFRHGDAAATILSALASSGFDGARLSVEISEGVLLDDSDVVRDQLKRLKRAGITIVLDDFGIDSSRLQSLARSDCDAVKLDRSFVQRVGEEPEMENLVRSLIGTAHSFDLQVLAEGVERAEQAHFLMSNDCQKVQGFLFGRPAPVRDLGAIIAKDLRKAMADAPEARPKSTAANA